jgi:uncharacterized protein YqjF (DUF2071 family)
MHLAPTYIGWLANGEMPADLLRVRPFLTAEWRHLAMLNYRVAPALLAAYVPVGTELDAFAGVTYMSLVAFMFSNTRVLGIAIPGHRTFEEVNLRFYVCRRTPTGEWRRGVVFVKEIVPRRAIALVARAAYNEPYVALPMRHQIAGSPDGGVSAEYGWRTARGWHVLAADATGPAAPIEMGSKAEFITEHYWGYTAQRGGGTVEYRVTHPRWNVWDATTRLTGPRLDILYGPALGDVLASEPDSAFLADGSAVSIEMPNRLAPAAAG